MQKRGFTLLEILIVVIILASVLAFAFPAYKRTQDRNLYTAATGVLIDLGNAVQNFQTDLATFGNPATFPTTCEKTQNEWQHPATVSGTFYYLQAQFADLHDMQNHFFPTSLLNMNIEFYFYLQYFNCLYAFYLFKKLIIISLIILFLFNKIFLFFY